VQEQRQEQWQVQEQRQVQNDYKPDGEVFSGGEPSGVEKLFEV